MPTFLAIAEVDQRQRFITNAAKLREMLGASRIIQRSIDIAKKAAKAPVELIWEVSGAHWFISPDLDALGKTLWEVRTEFHKLGLSVTFAVREYSKDKFKEHLRELEEEEMWKAKNSKGGEDGAPRSPLFAQCNIQGQLPANCWRPDLTGSMSDRRLIAQQTFERGHASREYVRKVLHRCRYVSDYKDRFHDFSDLVFSDSDSYIALLKADGDGVGRLLPVIDWPALADALHTTEENAALRFSQELNKVVQDSLDATVNEITGDDPHKAKSCFPILPLVTAGDDLWILCRRDLAFSLATALGRKYENAAAANEVLQAAAGRRRLTMSFGLLFAKQGFPFDAQLELAEELERSAKLYRKEQKGDQGCFDFHWLESSGRETISETRNHGFAYQDDPDKFRLTTRPWTIPETEQVLEAARRFARLPRRKRHQIDEILRFGVGLSNLAYTRWLQSLAKEQQAALAQAMSLLPTRLRPQSPSPWTAYDHNKFWSILPELAQLSEIAGAPSPQSRGHSESAAGPEVAA